MEKKIHFAPVYTHYFTHQDIRFVSGLILWNNTLQANCCWKGEGCFTVNDFDASSSSSKDLSLSCIDWQDPFYKFEQLSNTVAASREICWAQSWQRLLCRSPAAHSDFWNTICKLKLRKEIWLQQDRWVCFCVCSVSWLWLMNKASGFAKVAENKCSFCSEVCLFFSQMSAFKYKELYIHICIFFPLLKHIYTHAFI